MIEKQGLKISCLAEGQSIRLKLIKALRTKRGVHYLLIPNVMRLPNKQVAMEWNY